MKVLFLTKLIEDRAYHPYTLYVLSAVCRAAGHETDFVDAISLPIIRKKMIEFRPDVVAISTVTARWSFFRTVAEQLKREFNVNIMVGGAHATVRPQIVLDPFIDAVCVMEGDEAMPEYLNRLEAGRSVDDVPNFAFKDPENPEGYRVNPLLPLVPDLDALPFPHYELTDSYAPSVNMPLRITITSRGCLYACKSCCHSAYRGLYTKQTGYYRRHSIDRAFAELNFLKDRYEIQFFAFFDDMFVTGDDWELEFAERYAREIALPFSCHMTVRHVRERSIEVLVKAGLRWVGISLEAAREDLLRKSLARPYSTDEFIEAIGKIRQFGVGTYVGNMLALPDSTLESDLLTLEINRRARVSFADSSIYIPLPGTTMGESARQRCLFDIQRFESNYHSTDPTVHKPVILNVPHRDVVRRLHCLFELAVDNDWVHRHIRTLIRLPLLGLYMLIWKVYDARKKRSHLFGDVHLTWRQQAALAYYTLVH